MLHHHHLHHPVRLKLEPTKTREKKREHPNFKFQVMNKELKPGILEAVV
jgi:hypothetical protein